MGRTGWEGDIHNYKEGQQPLPTALAKNCNLRMHTVFPRGPFVKKDKGLESLILLERDIPLLERQSIAGVILPRRFSDIISPQSLLPIAADLLGGCVAT